MIGIVLPNESTQADPRHIADLARLAEQLDFDSVWLPDHLLPPEPYGEVYGGVFEPLILLAHIAAVTTRIALGTSVVILPLRDPFLAAKQVATLERLAPGRVILGVGVGWQQSEFTALGIPFAERGARADEAIDLIGHLHASGDGHYTGRFYRADGGVFEPRPTRPIPLLLGGTSDAGLRRAARAGDYWQAVHVTPDQFREHAARLRSLAGEIHTVSPGVVIQPDADADATDVLHEIERWTAAGAEHLAIYFGDLDTAAHRMRTAAAQRGTLPPHRERP